MKFFNNEKYLVSMALATFLTVTTASAVADDTELFSAVRNNPRVLFVLDASGSMGRSDGLGISRIDRMKEALELLLSSVESTNIGLMRFSRPFGGGPEVELIHPVVDVDVAANRDSLRNVASNIPLGRLTGGGTPSVAALYEAQRYFSGSTPYRGVTPDGAATYTSPTTHQCQASYIVLLTDGQPTRDTLAVSDLTPIYGPCDSEPENKGTCGTELVSNLSTYDQLPHINGPDPDTIITHSIGFNIRNDWINRIAAQGQGEYRDAASAAELLVAFQGLLDASRGNSGSGTAAVPVNAFNENRHGNEMYYSFFGASDFPRWEGNIKKYRLLDGVIVDKNNVPLIVGGSLSDTSVSLWSDTVDGDSIEAGGMAARLPANRKWYTDEGQLPAADGSITPLLVTAANQVTQASMGSTSPDEHNNLISWVRGTDSIGHREDHTDTTKPNRYLADSLHGSPVVASYRSQASSGLNDQVLFSATNMGVLHATDPETGDEIWSYSPSELLPNIKKYVDNTDADSHVYGLDGQIVLHTIPKATTTFDHEIDEAMLFLTQRRGGSGVFALDVTNALRPSNPFNVKWKIQGGIADTDFRDLAQTWSTPQIIPIKHGCPGACTTRNVLMFSGGYNPIYDDKDLSYPVSPDATGHGNAVYFVDPENGDLLWSAGKGSHHKLNLPLMMDSIPTTPLPVDTDADGIVNTLFISDIAGHIWRIDLDQKANSLDDLAIGGGMIADLNETGDRRRFFNRPDVVVNGNTNGLAKFNVVLGSGMRSSPLHTEPDNNRIFSLIDPWVFTHPVGDEIDASTGRLKSDYRYVEKSDGTKAIITPDRMKNYDAGDASETLEHGYFKTLEAGEKVLTETITHAGRVFLTTYMPPSDLSSPAHCGAAFLGASRLYILDLLTGGNELPSGLGDPYLAIGSGIVAAGSIIDTGDSNGPSFIIGTTAIDLDVLLAPDNPNIFRRFFRTGWRELDD